MDKKEILESIIYSYAKGSKTKFAQMIGVKPQTIHSWLTRASFDIDLIFSKLEDISPEFLLSGEGDIRLKKNKNRIQTTQIHIPNSYDPIIEEQFIPLLSEDAIAGIVENVDMQHIYDVGKIFIPGMPKCDGAIKITGDSMYPLLKSGDIVAFKRVYSVENIFWGEMYLLFIDEDGDKYITVKWVKKHDSDPSKIVLVSQNTHHSPREVYLRHIMQLCLIKFSIRFNTMM